MASSHVRQTVTAGNADMLSHKVEPMKRPGFGRAGRKVVVQTNFFKIKAPNLTEIYQYCVFIDAERYPDNKSPRGGNGYNRHGGSGNSKEWADIAPSAFIGYNRAIMAAWCKSHIPKYPVAYDGRKTMYSPCELPREIENIEPGGVRFAMEADSDGPAHANSRQNSIETIYVRVRQVAVLNARDIFQNGNTSNTLESNSALAGIDTLLGTGPLKTHVQVGRSFYHSSGASSLGDGADAWRGFYQSARLSMNGLLINMDESRTPFWSCGNKPLRDLVTELRCNIYSGDRRENKRAAKAMFGLKVRATHTRITYRVHGFSEKSAQEETFFDAEANKTVSVADYLKHKYGVTLKNPHDPCVITNPKKKTMMPLELMVIQTGQRLSKPMTPDQTTNMIRVAATKPHARAQGAVAAMQRVKHNEDPTCKAFGITIDQQLMKINARILPTPTMTYNNGKREAPRYGAWNNQHRQQLMSPSHAFTWCVLNLTRKSEGEIRGFVGNLVKAAQGNGIRMTEKIAVFKGEERNVEDKMRQIANTYKDPKYHVNRFPLQLILIVKFKQDTECYNAIKRVGDLELGIATQVMLAKHLQPRQGTYYGNLLLKINAKLGGTNSVPMPVAGVANVPFGNRPHMILGADVTHPAGGGNRPSVAALVGSRDKLNSQFTGSLRNMPPRQELMTEMADMFGEVYSRYAEKWPWGPNVKPESIIMFRDGVSEGQFEQVLDSELAGLRRACHTIDPRWNPKITFIIVTKRHHARFFPAPKDAERSGNIPPGTVIDTDITSSQFYDFYLNSHAGIQGTSRPSKYTVLIDENNINVDALQAYVFRMAHGYARCNRSVSIVQSAYYAHLLAFRGRAYLNEEGSDTASTNTSSYGDQVAIPTTVPLHDKLSKRLYFI